MELATQLATSLVSLVVRYVIGVNESPFTKRCNKTNIQREFHVTGLYETVFRLTAFSSETQRLLPPSSRQKSMM
jgi:hypothetical protein